MRARIVRNVFCGVATILTASQFYLPLAKEQSREEIEVKSVLQAVADCNYWGEEVGSDPERNAELQKGYEKDCAEALRKLETGTAHYPKNPNFIVGIRDLLAAENILSTEPFIHDYCKNVASYFATHPDSPIKQDFNSICGISNSQ